MEIRGSLSGWMGNAGVLSLELWTDIKTQLRIHNARVASILTPLFCLQISRRYFQNKNDCNPCCFVYKSVNMRSKRMWCSSAWISVLYMTRNRARTARVSRCASCSRFYTVRVKGRGEPRTPQNSSPANIKPLIHIHKHIRGM